MRRPWWRRAGVAAIVAARVAAACGVGTAADAPLRDDGSGADRVWDRPVAAAPQPADIGGDYVVPAVRRPLPRGGWLQAADAVALAAALGATAVLCVRGRRRWQFAVVSWASLGYFGFYRQGCVCAVGSLQNVATACVEPQAAVPWIVTVFFLLPLAAALAFGRVFCGGACPLGALQDAVAIRPQQLPLWVDRWGGALRYAYLAAAIGYAVQPLSRREFLICRFDPLVGLFRLEGSPALLLSGVALLLVGVVVGRPYCRFLCPYGALLGIVARFACRPVAVTPDRELDCGLCGDACPFGAIVERRAEPSRCLACGRCFRACPRQRRAWGWDVEAPPPEGPGVARDPAAARRGAPCD